MSIDDIIDVLFDGTKEEIAALDGVRYEIGDDCEGMLLQFGDELIRADGNYSDASCVKFFGRNHAFMRKAA